VEIAFKCEDEETQPATRGLYRPYKAAESCHTKTGHMPLKQTSEYTQRTSKDQLIFIFSR
jgi:hypothetical protein